MRSVLDHFRLIIRGLGVLNKLSPWNMLAKIFKSFCDAIIPFVNLYLSAEILDALVEQRSIKDILFYVFITVISNIVLSLFSHLMDTVNYVKWNQFYLRYNMSIGEKVMSLDYSEIEDPETHKKMKNLDDAMKISNYGLIKLHSRIPLFFQNLFSVLFSLLFTLSVIFQKGTGTGIVAFANSIFADILLIGFIVIVCVVCVIGNTKISIESYSLLGVLSKLNRVFDYYLNQYLDGHRAGKDIRLYKQKNLILDEIDSFGKGSQRLVDKINFVTCKNNVLIALATFFLVFYTYSYVGLKAIAGVFAVGSIMKYSGSILNFSNAISGMMDAASQLWANHPYLVKYFEFMDLPTAAEHAKGEKRIALSKMKNYDIEFSHVSFKYPNTSDYVLKDVNLKIVSGQKVAVVGRNGSGKTTLIKLLCRLYEPTAGFILLNGTNIQEFDYDDYMAMLGVVFQDFKLFSFSLGQNVSANDDYDFERTKVALQKTGFSTRLNTMIAGTETILYKDFDAEGVEISGGEAQKIALARAIYKEAPIIVLDEPTSALDPIAESEIYSSFNKITENKTAIYISHRLSSCKFCDLIIVFENGEIVELGTHDKLVENKTGTYYKLWEAQAQYYNPKYTQS